MIRAGVRFTQLCSLASMLFVGACGDGDDCAERVALPCDIREQACRCTVFDETRKVRNQKGASLPPARVITRDEYAREVRGEVSGQMAPEGARVYQETLKVLGLLPAGMSLDEAETEAQIRGVAAYYDSREKKITIIDDAAADPDEGVFTLSHEYVHALQDQRERIEQLWDEEETTDGLLSVKTLLEGEATLLSDLVMLQAVARTFDAQALSRLEGFYDATLKAIVKSKAPLTEAQLALAYPVGAMTLGKAYLARGIAGVEGFYRSRPRTVTGWLDESRSPTLPGTVGCGRPDAPPGYKPWAPDRLGATAAIAIGASLGFDTEGMRDLASLWSADQFALYSVEGTPSSVAVSWYLTFAGGAELATQLETRLRAARPMLEVTRSGSRLQIVGTSDPAGVGAWSARATCNAEKSRGLEDERRIGPGFGHILPWLARVHAEAHGHEPPAMHP